MWDCVTNFSISFAIIFCYIIFLFHSIDATPDEFNCLAKYVNDSSNQYSNCIMRIIDNSLLVIYSKGQISAGTELRYNVDFLNVLKFISSLVILEQES